MLQMSPAGCRNRNTK